MRLVTYLEHPQCTSLTGTARDVHVANLFRRTVPTFSRRETTGNHESHRFQAGSLLSPGVAGNPPQRAPHLWRSFSRSSGVILSHFSLRPRRPRLPPELQLPNRMRLRRSKPRACQKVIMCRPKIGGRSQFHRCITSSPKSQVKRTMAGGAMSAIQSFFITFLISQETRRERFAVACAGAVRRSACARAACSRLRRSQPRAL